jgi:hypothetical protein
VQYVTSLVSIDSLYSKEFIETNIIGFDQEWDKLDPFTLSTQSLSAKRWSNFH